METLALRSPYGQLFRSCVRAAHVAGASDIHIEPTKSGLDIRFRVFGEMQPLLGYGIYTVGPGKLDGAAKKVGVTHVPDFGT